MIHICPQEIIAVVQAVQGLQPLLGVVSMWCKACVDGTHKSCEDHAHSTNGEDHDQRE